jgi:hypothetical protein
VRVRFKIDRSENVATAGSCFAQHISKSLQGKGHTFFITEAAPKNLTKEQAGELNYGIYSARYGNVYTPRQLLQLYDRAFGEFRPVGNSWQGSDGSYIDPFRPKIEPSGFASEDALIASRTDHLAAVRTMFEKLDVFVFTLGLTEAWQAKADGAVVPLPPGAAGADGGRDYEFVNFDFATVQKDLNDFLDRLKNVNPSAKAILTVSPVPLVATYEDRHALVSTTYSKSVLRVAADGMSKKYSWVDYFPSYEIITGSFNRGAYFEKDLRSVTPEGVAHVMRIFMKHYSSEDRKVSRSLDEEISAGSQIVCEEENLEA